MNAEHNGPMRAEGEIDAVLKMLGETQPPDALVSRVHRNLESAMARSQRAKSGRNIWIPVTCVAMAAVVLVAMFAPMHRTPETRASAVETAKLVETLPESLTALVPLVAPVANKSSSEMERSAQFSAKRRIREGRERRHAANLLSYPLTQQEKLLLRFVRTAKPADLQALNPEYQAKVDAQQNADFDAYLKSGSRSDTESATQTNQSTQE